VTKNEFIHLVADGFLAGHNGWSKVYEHRRHYKLAIGRSIPSACFVFIDLGCRPDYYRFGHGVGWCPSLTYFQEWKERRANPPDYPRNGRLKNLARIEKPLDFENEEMRVSTFSLDRPFADYDLEKSDETKLRALMLSEMEDIALPYLRMMLRARHGLDLSQDEISQSPGVGV
jgi:hypothetical protein